MKYYIAGVTLFFLLACALPGLSQPAAVPTFDTNSIPTIVALTANAAMAQTATVPISTPDIASILAQSTLDQLPDGRAKYTDNEIGFEITFPAGWLTVRANSDEFNAAFANEATKNDMLRKQMQLDLDDYEPGTDRLYSYPLRPDLEKNYAFGFSGLEWDADDTAPIDEAGMGKFVRGMESSGTIPGFRADTAQIYDNMGQVKVVEVGGQFSISDGQGGVVPFYATFVFFKPTDGSTVLVRFTYLKDYKVELYSDVTSVIASIKLLGQ
jgi:hypothetical protein